MVYAEPSYGVGVGVPLRLGPDRQAYRAHSSINSALLISDAHGTAQTHSARDNHYSPDRQDTQMTPSTSSSLTASALRPSRS